MEYSAVGGTPVLRARLQELFGLADTPRVGVRGTTPVEVHLLSPAGRPVQVTTDLASFWAVAYFDVCRAGAYTRSHFRST